MYTAFYGLRELPFDLSPNPKYLLMTPRHREALANLQYGISSRKSITLLLGEAGTGKTTLVRAALESDACHGARILHLNNPALRRGEFIEFLARGFELGQQAMTSKTTMLHELERVLRERRAAGETIALVIDEAQSLSHELLEEIRLLANIETSTEKLLPVVLAGQPELADRLNETSLRQLKQRVALRCHLGLLDRSETVGYIAGRLRVAGGDAGHIFTREAVEIVVDRSGGVPRTINVICDNALVGGFAAGTKPVGAKIVRDVCDEFDLGQRSTKAISPAPAAHADPPAGPASSKQATAAQPLFGAVNRRRRFSFF
jgi:general secretion pathway protein A